MRSTQQHISETRPAESGTENKDASGADREAEVAGLTDEQVELLLLQKLDQRQKRK